MKNPQTRSSWPTWIWTLTAFVFAAGSVAWSVVSLRQWMAEQAEAKAAETWDRSARRRWEPEPEPLPPATPLASAAFQSRRPTSGLHNASQLFNTTSVWTIELRFSPESWTAMEPRQIEPLRERWGPNGEFLLRNPEASRNGLAGVRGIEFDWVEADVFFEDQAFPRSAVRYKGNGTYLRSQRSIKRPLKIDLNKHVKSHELAGRTTLNLANLITDDSCLHDVLAYELYRDAGVVAPRTAYARVWIRTNDAPSRYLGVYALVENIDTDFAGECLGTRQGAIFKPVTHDLFADLGEDWAAYDGIYDPKHKITAAQSGRVIEFARLLTHADDATYAARVGEYLDLDSFARFLAVTVLLSSYDGFLHNGQNFYVWLAPDTQRFHFLPWDLDNAWGKFGVSGSAMDRAEASIRQPWIGRHRLLERTLAVPEFLTLYRATLDRLLRETFVPERLHRRVDEMAALLRPMVAEESSRKATRFEQAVTRTTLASEPEEDGGWGRSRTPHPLKGFITERARSVREQLDGTSDGVVLQRWR